MLRTGTQKRKSIFRISGARPILNIEVKTKEDLGRCVHEQRYCTTARESDNQEEGMILQVA